MSDPTPTTPPRSARTRAVTSGRGASGRSLAPVLWQTTVFESESLESAHRDATATRSDGFYSRYGNPTVNAFEDAIAELEGAEAARAFASGMGAMFAVVLGLCSKGDHIVTQQRIYSGTTLLLQNVCARFGIEVTVVDGTDPEAWAAAVRPGRTMLLVAETPANPRLELVDLERLAAIPGPMKVVDATFATPLGQHTLASGVDLVVHSATKAIAGHNDASLGVVAGSRELIDWIWGFAVLQGANASPTDALNGLRGLRTLPLRVAAQSSTALALAEALEAHPAVATVCYPGLESFPQRDLARRQMLIDGGMLTFDVVGGAEAGRRVVESVRLCRLATSLGGPETLVTHPVSTTHAGLYPDELAAAGIGPGTIRVSCGLESTDDVLADLLTALDDLPGRPAVG